MNKSMIAIGFALIFSFLASVGFANEMDLNSGSGPMISEKNPAGNEKNMALNGVESADVDNAQPDLPFLLQQNQRACLDGCQMEFESCMKSADSADSKYRCNDNRWRCTRSCDNQWYNRLQL